MEKLLLNYVIELFIDFIKFDVIILQFRLSFGDK